MFSPQKTKHNVKLGIRCGSFVNMNKQCTVLTCKKNVFCALVNIIKVIIRDNTNGNKVLFGYNIVLCIKLELHIQLAKELLYFVYINTA